MVEKDKDNMNRLDHISMYYYCELTKPIGDDDQKIDRRF